MLGFVPLPNLRKLFVLIYQTHVNILLFSQHIIAGRDSEIAPTEALDSEYLS